MAASTRRWLIERRLVLLAGLAAALPVMVSTVEMLATGWALLGDDAEIAVSAWDVFTPHSPLLGPVSTGYSAVAGEPVFHPGPLLFWLLALPVRLPWDGALELTVGLVNVASIMGCVALAHRRGGRPLMFAVALAVPVMLGSLPADAYSDIWNPSAPLLPFTLLLFLAWSLACGDYRLLPLTVLVASFVSQCHLAYLTPAVGLLVVGLGGLLLTSRVALRDRDVRVWLGVAALVALVCWSAPAIEQVTNDPGNARLIYRAIRADKETLGLAPGGRAVVHTVGIPPWWLRDPQYGLARVVDLSVSPSSVATGSTVLILAALVATMVVARRRRRGDLVAAALIALVLCLALLVATASTPHSSFATLDYSLRWSAPAGMWVWLTVGWSVGVLFLGGLLARARLPRVPAPAALVAVAAVAGVVGVSGELKHKPYDQMRVIADSLDADLPAADSAAVVASGGPDAAFMALSFEAGVTYVLRRKGRSVIVPPLSEYLGPEYRRGPYEQVVRLDLGTPPPDQARVIARVVVSEAERDTAIAVSVLPARREAR